MSTLLLVEDNPHIMKINGEMLSMRGYEVLKAASVSECMEAFRWHPIDLVVLDIMLPDGNGVDLCREIKNRYHVPILLLSALGDSRDVVEGLRAGADDYLAKPYDLEVLAARIEARLRRVTEINRYSCYGDLELDTFSRRGYLFGEDLLLTQKEFSLLLLLIRSGDRPVPASTLVQEIWNDQGESSSRALWTLISRVRKKLCSEKSRLEIISKRGDGYILEQM